MLAMVNGGNTELGITSTNFSGKYVILMRSLDFKSIFSYNDYTTTKYGDLNTDGIVENIKTELTKTEEGCRGFKPIGRDWLYGGFAGTFDGRNNEIKNLYEKNGVEDNDLGLFGIIHDSTIMNLTVGGKIEMIGDVTSYTYATGGIVAFSRR